MQLGVVLVLIEVPWWVFVLGTALVVMLTYWASTRGREPR